MISYKIVHDMPGRMRIRYGSNVFNKLQSHVLLDNIMQWTMVNSAEVNYKTGSILFCFDENKRYDLLHQLDTLDLSYLKDINEEIYSNFPREKELDAMNQQYKKDIIKLIVRRYLLKWLLPTPLNAVYTIYTSIRYLEAGLKSLSNFKVNVSVLDASSISVCMLQGDFNTASSIILLLSISELLESYTKKKTKLQLGESLSLQFDKIWIYNNGVEMQIPMQELKKDMIVVLQLGSMIPIDGEIVEGDAMINESSFTGEPLSKHVSIGDSVFAGTLIEEGKIYVKVRNLQDESRIANIMNMIDTCENLKASIQANAEHLADSIVPLSFLGFFSVFALTRNLTKATSVLMVDYSCAIRLSTSISIISAMREAALMNVLVKGGKYLEIMKDADVIVFDKTGTLTNALPVVQKIVPLHGYSREEVLKISACIEEHFPHSVANAIVKQAQIEGINHQEEHAKVEYIIAHGIATSLYGKHVVIGSDHFIFEDEGVIKTEEIKQIILDLQKQGASSLIYLAIGNELVGIISIYDPLKEDAPYVIEKLRKTGISQVVMLTGDSRYGAQKVAEQLQLDDYRYEVLPEDKATYIKELKQNGHTVIMVGDGVNDTPALSNADVSISMQDSSDLARELADVTLVSNQLQEIVRLRILSQELFKRIQNNYRNIVVFNTSLIILGAFGLLTPNISSLLHNGSTFTISALTARPLLSQEQKLSV